VLIEFSTHFWVICFRISILSFALLSNTFFVLAKVTSIKLIVRFQELWSRIGVK